MSNNGGLPPVPVAYHLPFVKYSKVPTANRATGVPFEDRISAAGIEPYGVAAEEMPLGWVIDDDRDRLSRLQIANDQAPRLTEVSTRPGPGGPTGLNKGPRRSQLVVGRRRIDRLLHRRVIRAGGSPTAQAEAAVVAGLPAVWRRPDRRRCRRRSAHNTWPRTRPWRRKQNTHWRSGGRNDCQDFLMGQALPCHHGDDCRPH